MRTPKEIINLIANTRIEQGITLTELSKKVGTTKATLSRYETGTRDFTLNNIDKYATALGVTVSYLLDIEPILETETGENIKQAMVEKKKDPAYLVNKLGVTPALLSLWLNGEKEPRPKKIIEIAKVLDVPTDWLIFGKEYAEKNKNNLENSVISKGVIFDLTKEITEASQALIFLEMEQLFFISKKSLLKLPILEVLKFANEVRVSLLEIKKM